jgi:flagellar basal body P-ring formation protein FlgA
MKTRLTLLITGLSACSALWAQPTLPAVHTSSQASAHADAPKPLFTYSREELLTELSQHLAEHYRVSGDLELELLRPFTAPPASEQPIRAVLLDAPSSLSSNLLVRVRFLAGDKPVGETTLLCRAALMREVWYSRTPIERGSNFDPSQLDTRRADTLRERDAIPASDPTAELNFVRAVPAGKLISWRDVSRRALVRKGEVIEVSAVDGMLSISMKAMAMENGSAGETVRVRNLESRKEFSALVVAESRAQVRF